MDYIPVVDIYVTRRGDSGYLEEDEPMTSPTRYYDADGNEIKLNTGKTYIALVPVDDWKSLVIE